MRQIVFDLETTGFRFDEGHRIVEIGAVELVNGALTGKTFHTYIDPERDVPQGAVEVHGLTADFLRGNPVFTEKTAGPAFQEFLGDAELIAHNGKAFDLPFLNAEFAAAGMDVVDNDLIDTLHLARRKFPGAPASLDALCSRFGVDTKQRQRDGHGALLDSRLLAEVYIELTGGAQAGLDLNDSAGARARQKAQGAARQRPKPLASTVTEAEAAAHADFIGEMGDASLWAKRAAL